MKEFDEQGNDGVDKETVKEESGGVDVEEIPKVDRKFMTASLLKNMKRGNLDEVDGIPGKRSRVNSDISGGSMIKLEVSQKSNEKNKSLPSTPVVATSTRRRNYSLCDTSLARNRSLLGSFTENALTGRLEPVKILDGFQLQLTASGTFFSPVTMLPVTVFLFDLNTTGCQHFSSAPVPYLGKCELAEPYRIPSSGTLQVSLFNPQQTVIKLFLTKFNVDDMPANSKTFIRHVWKWNVVGGNSESKNLQYLIHYRLSSDRRKRIYLHTDIRILFSQDSTRDALLLPKESLSSGFKYELCDHVETPSNPKYSN